MLSDLVSVIIPTFNRAHLVIRALESVRIQTYRPVQIIVVDDGSTDNTESVIANWIRQKSEASLECRYIKQRNSGASRARNVGVHASTGKYIAFLDSDDVWYADKLVKQVEVLRSKSSQVGLVYTSVVAIGGSGAKTRYQATHRGRVLRNHLRENIIPGGGSGVVVRRSVLEDVGLFDDKLPSRQDYELWLRILKKYDAEYVGDVLVEIDFSSSGRISDNHREKLDARDLVFQKHQSLYRKFNLVADYEYRSAWLCHHMIGNVSEARRRYIRVFKMRPLYLRALWGTIKTFMPRARLHCLVP